MDLTTTSHYDRKTATVRAEEGTTREGQAYLYVSDAQLTPNTLDRLRHELRYSSRWAWDMPQHGCAQMTSDGAALERLLVLREWLEMGGYLVVPESSPERWSRLDEVEGWLRDTRSADHLEALEAMPCPHETGCPWVDRLAAMDPADAIAEVDARLELYVEMFGDMRSEEA